MALGQGLGPKTCGGPKHGPWCPLGWLGRPSPPTGQWHPPSNTLHPPPCFFFMVLGGCLGVQVVHPHGGPHHAPHVATCNPPHTLPTLGGHGGAQGTEMHQPPPHTHNKFYWWWCTPLGGCKCHNMPPKGTMALAWPNVVVVHPIAAPPWALCHGGPWHQVCTFVEFWQKWGCWWGGACAPNKVPPLPWPPPHNRG